MDQRAAIDLDPEDHAVVAGLLRLHVPGCEVLAYGSRVSGTAGPHSDLDLAVVGASEVGPFALMDLREAFDESYLPFRVDVMDWNAIPASFREEITSKHVILQHKMHNDIHTST